MNKNNLRQTHRYLVKSCFNSCPLETLVLLNSYWDIIYGIDGISSKDSNNENDDHKINNFMEKLSSTGFKKLINFPAYGFPVSLKKMYFSSMGFDINEINHLLLSDESFVFQSIGSEGEPLHYTQSNYVPVMTKRLSILRENGTKMGLLTPSDYFKAMKNWRGLVTCIGEKAKNHNTSHAEETKGEKSKHNAASASMIGDIVQSLLKTSDLKSVKNVLTYLQEYFGVKESQKNLARDIFELPKYSRYAISCGVTHNKNISNLKSYQLCQTLHWLENKGFHKSQIRRALPLLYYHPAILEQKILEIQEMEEFQPWSEQLEAQNCITTDENRILEVLLYLVEKEFNFSDEGTYFAEGNSKAISLNNFFTESFCKEILEYTGVKLLPEKLDKNIDKKESDYILQDTNENTPELKLGMINFQDFIYLHHPTKNEPNKRLSDESENLTSNSIAHSHSAFLKSDKNCLISVNRQFCSMSKNDRYTPRSAMNMSTKPAKKTTFFKMPKVIHITNPLNWLDMKLKYYGLTTSVDPKFSEHDFIRGAKQVKQLIYEYMGWNQE